MSKLHLFVVLLCFVCIHPAWSQDALPEPGAQQPGAVDQPAAPAERPAAGAQQPAGSAAQTQRQQVSYVIGRNIGNDLRRNEIDLDYQSLVAGIRDAITNAKPKWSDAELEAAMQQFQQQMQQKAAGRMQQAQQQGAANKQQAEQFLAQNKQQPGVQSLASGLQYKVLKEGNGASPTIDDTVRVHYRGTLLDGTEFDSSYARNEPIEFPVNGVIQGWTEALQKMKVGDKWQLYVPPALAYGETPHPDSGIPPNSLLVFEVELLGIQGK
jgi:FKBP-type peptidyl-prolyl cis-trans isomerase FklB